MSATTADILKCFALPGSVVSAAPYGNGHINDTYRVVCCEGGRESRFILQKINRNVFHRPEEVMENITGILGFITSKIEASGGDPQREALSLIPAREGKPFVTDEQGECWRIYRFIDRTVCYENAGDEEIFRRSAMAFGRFQKLLANYPAEKLHVTIPDFHNTPARFRQFWNAVLEDAAHRRKEVEEEISFLAEKEALSRKLERAHREGILPIRVTHNDTKLNNILFDACSGKALCVLDLDTVMPGFSVTDFGDAIRFGASTAAEDEPDLGKVHFDRHLYRVYREGFLEGCGGSLLEGEEALLFEGAKVITYEQALRFLADYLAGDVYYKISRPDHNLLRARTQIRLLQEMLECDPLQ